MARPDLVKIVTTAPVGDAADAVRAAMADAGAGVVGDYSHCTFSIRGQGRFLPGDGADPHIGAVGALEVVEEERIEVPCPRSIARSVIEAIKNVHPYEEVIVDVYPLVDIDDLP